MALPARLGCLVLCLCGAAPASACEAYFVAVFGSQRTPGLPRHTHTFAVFVRAMGDGPCPRAWRLECHTISWLPGSMEVRALRLRPECGVNLDLDATLRWALGSGQQVFVWGPYQIQKTLYDRALWQIAHLDSGEVRYKAVDTGFPADRVSNCIHAVSDLARRGPRLRVATPGWGETASFRVTRELSPWIVDPCRVHDWVGDGIGLRNYPLVRRELEPPLLIQRLRGGPPAAYGP